MGEWRFRMVLLSARYIEVPWHEMASKKQKTDHSTMGRYKDINVNIQHLSLSTTGLCSLGAALYFLFILSLAERRGIQRASSSKDEMTFRWKLLRVCSNIFPATSSHCP